MEKKYNYYTPIKLAYKLLDLIPSSKDISSVADICCGTWNLLSAAKKRFPNASIIGVDTSPLARDVSLENSVFYLIDGRNFANIAERRQIKFDLLLSNPPFGSLNVHQKKYDKKGDALTKSKRYESEFLYANTKILKENGYLLIILPITYALGQQFVKQREWIAVNYEVLNIIFLPPDTFGSKDLNTVALLLKKTNRRDNYWSVVLNAKKVDEDWALTHASVIPSSRISSGNWFTSSQELNPEIIIYRGSISSHYFSLQGTPILHCSSIVQDGMWIPSHRKCSGIRDSQKKYVESGDIIINRIGKFSSFWCVYEGEKCLISDCLIVIKSPSTEVLHKMRNLTENGRLCVPRLGTSTPYISAKDLISYLSR